MRGLVPDSMRRDLDRLIEVLRAHRLRARELMVEGLRSDRLSELLRSWASISARARGTAGRRPPRCSAADRRAGRRADPEGLPPDGEDGASRSTTTAPRRSTTSFARRARSFATCSSCSGLSSSGDVVKPMVKALKALQDVLGRHQDREVQVGLLRSLRASRRAAGRSGRADGDGRARRPLERGRAPHARRVRRELRRLRGQRPAGAREGDLRLSQVLATYNIKGGVGKTSAAVNLAYLAARDGAPGRCSGTSTPRAPRPTCSGSSRRSVAAGGSCPRPRPRSRADQRHRLRASRPAAGRFPLPTHGPRARPLQAPDPPAARVLEPLARVITSTSSSTARRASPWCQRACSRPPTRCSCRSSRRPCPRGLRPARRARREAARRCSRSSRWSMCRKSLHREVMARLRAAAPRGDARRGDPDGGRGRADGDGASAVPCSRPASRAAVAYQALWRDVRPRLSNSLERR